MKYDKITVATPGYTDYDSNDYPVHVPGELDLYFMEDGTVRWNLQEKHK